MARAGRGSDQFPLRLPDRMRDRIKAAAERSGRSMNAEIVRALELAFPEPVSIATRISELGVLFSAFSKVRGYDAAVEEITDVILDLIEAGASGHDPTIDEGVVQDMRQALSRWEILREGEAIVNKKLVDEKYPKSSGDD